MLGLASSVGWKESIYVGSANSWLNLIGTTSPDRIVSPRPLYSIKLSASHYLQESEFSASFPAWKHILALQFFLRLHRVNVRKWHSSDWPGYIQVSHLFMHGAEFRVARIQHSSMSNVSLNMKLIESNVWPPADDEAFKALCVHHSARRSKSNSFRRYISFHSLSSQGRRPRDIGAPIVWICLEFGLSRPSDWKKLLGS